MLWVTNAKYVGDYRLWLSFNNGTSGEVDLLDRLYGEVFEPLKNLEQFCQVKFDPDMDTVVWPNGANLAPEFLYDKVIERRGGIRGEVRSAAQCGSDDEILHVTAANYLGDYRVSLEFSDRTSGEVDLSAALRGPMLEPLKDKALFGQVRFDPEADTIVWPNGADLAPEFLKELVVRQAVLPAKAS